MKRNEAAVAPESGAKQTVKKKLKMAALVCISAVAAFILFDFLAATLQIVSWTHPEKIGFSETPAEHLPALDYHTFSLTVDGKTITGWQIPAQEPMDEDAEEWNTVTEFSDKTVVFAPNYDSNREMNDLGGIDYFASLCAAGYNVFVFDWSGSGYSDGSVNVFDLDKTEELRAVAEYAAQTSGADFIAVQGAGFGCYPAARVAAECGFVDALILDSCYDDFSDWFYGNFNEWAAVSFAPVRETVRLLFPLYSGVDVNGAALSEPINALNGKYVMIVQGAQDEQFGVKDAQRLAALAATDNTSELWIAEGCNHLRTYSANPSVYVNRITAFLASAAAPKEA